MTPATNPANYRTVTRNHKPCLVCVDCGRESMPGSRSLTHARNCDLAGALELPAGGLEARPARGLELRPAGGLELGVDQELLELRRAGPPPPGRGAPTTTGPLTTLEASPSDPTLPSWASG